MNPSCDHLQYQQVWFSERLLSKWDRKYALQPESQWDVAKYWDKLMISLLLKEIANLVTTVC